MGCAGSAPVPVVVGHPVAEPPASAAKATAPASYSAPSSSRLGGKAAQESDTVTVSRAQLAEMIDHAVEERLRKT